MGYHRTYVTKIERGALEPTVDFATRADRTLRLAGELIRRWEAFDASRSHPSRARQPRPAVPEELIADLLVDHDEAWLRRGSDAYHLHMRKTILNCGETPITRFFMRVAVDRYPHDSARSNEFYRGNPLTLDELQIEARCDGEPMDFEAARDQDSSKEIWLLFRNSERQFPRYPRKDCALDYTFRVALDKWGDYFQRSVRVPTRRISVHLEFPRTPAPKVWGLEISPTAGERPFANPINSELLANTVRFHWSAPRPPVSARYRLEWDLTQTPQEDTHDDPPQHGTQGDGHPTRR